ncbi:hypothetical protein Syun_005712 [Stephania yunnanensis]|uniref:Tr-type G domain-containing protein n=1 Tax=Stephania yunnanensis TaxID=152371 RepID=A0AAP0Q0N4_9MAGN
MWVCGDMASTWLLHVQIAPSQKALSAQGVIHVDATSPHTKSTPPNNAFPKGVIAYSRKTKEMEVPDEVVELNETRENKRHLNVVFIGHVDAGKSTTGGPILFSSGQVDDRTIQKHENEAKDKSRESW